MHPGKRHRTTLNTQRSLLATAITCALAASVPLTAQADTDLTGVNNSYSWDTGNLNVNSGATVSGSSYGIRAQSTNKGVLTNKGLIQGTSSGLAIYSITVASVSNSGTIFGSIGIYNSGNIVTVSNQGTISGTDTGIRNAGTINTLTNGSTGTIAGSSGSGLLNRGVISTLNNQGTIAGSQAGINNTGTITGLTNSGVISGLNAINVQGGTVTTITNSGLIKSTGGSAIRVDNNSLLGSINNTGTIAGGIYDNTAATLTISGATDGSFGTLTGSSGATGAADISTLQAPALVFTGSTLLNDNLQAVTTNNQGTLQINNGLSVAGNYHQGAQGQLLIGVANGATANGSASDVGYGRLAVQGAVTLDPGATIGLKSLGSYGFANGQRYLVITATDGTGSNYNAGALNYVVPGLSATGAAVTAGTAKDLVVTLASTATPGNGGGSNSGSGNDNSGSGNSSGNGSGTDTSGSGSGSGNGSGTDTSGSGSGSGNGSGTDTSGSGSGSGNGSGTDTSGDGSNSGNGSGSTRITNLATTKVARSTLDGLYRYPGVDPALLNVFDAAIAAGAGSTSAANQAGAQLAPAATLAAITQASVNTTQQVINQAQSRVDAGRSVANGLASGDAAGPAVGLWTQGFGGTTHQDERDDVSGYSGRYGGMVVGADGLWNDDWRLGGMFSYAHSTIDNSGDNHGSSARANSYGLFAYASYNANPWYLDLTAGAIQHQYKTEREVEYPGVNGDAKASHDGMQYVASAQAGYPIDVGNNTRVTPLAGLTGSSLHQASYTEHGGDGAALHVAPDNTQSLKSDLGAKVEKAFTTSYGNLVPWAQLTWRHEYENNRVQSDNYFAADNTSATDFSTAGPKSTANTGVMSLGATLISSDEIAVSARYNLEAGSGFTGQNGALQVHWGF